MNPIRVIENESLLRRFSKELRTGIFNFMNSDQYATFLLEMLNHIKDTQEQLDEANAQVKEMENLDRRHVCCCCGKCV